MKPVFHKLALGILCTAAACYGYVFLKGPQGVPHLLEKRREIRTLQDQNADLRESNRKKKEQIGRLHNNEAEQELLIRDKMKLGKKNETTYIESGTKK